MNSSRFWVGLLCIVSSNSVYSLYGRACGPGLCERKLSKCDGIEGFTSWIHDVLFSLLFKNSFSVFYSKCSSAGEYLVATD